MSSFRDPNRPLAPRTLENYNYHRRRTRITPRVRHAVKLWESGAVKTKKEAASITGVSTSWLGKSMLHSPVVAEYAQGIETEIRRRAVDLSAVIEGLGAKAVERIAHLMDKAGKEDVQLRAAQDILDRNPATSKTRRVAIESLTLSGRDVAALVNAMQSGNGLKEEFVQAATGDFTPALENGDHQYATRSEEIR